MPRFASSGDMERVEFATSALNPEGIAPSSPGLSRPRGTTLGQSQTIPATPTGLCRSPRWCTIAAMPQSLSAVYIHLVFSTKDRRRLLRDLSIRNSLHAYLGAVSKQLDCPTISVGGVEDHVHLLARFGRTITQAEWVKELKRVSSVWLKEQGMDYHDFHWQGGYADFSVSQSNLDQVKQYILCQSEHHQKVGFQDELRALLRKHEMEWDEKYVWD